jgi:(p)ppGpp synthase/HD superfamily hydrolase
MPESSADAPPLTDRFQHAFALASRVHATQLRKGTRVPYVAHLMSVAALALEHGADEDTAIAALLHDSVEDSGNGLAMEADIREQFGDRAAAIVMACSDAVGVAGQPKPPWRDRKTTYIAHLAEVSDRGVLLVSACDKLHNARSIVADLRTIGAELWLRFSEKDPAAHIWYYRSLAACYSGQIPAGLAAELDRVIDQMESLAAATAAS